MIMRSIDYKIRDAVEAIKIEAGDVIDGPDGAVYTVLSSEQQAYSVVLELQHFILPTDIITKRYYLAKPIIRLNPTYSESV